METSRIKIEVECYKHKDLLLMSNAIKDPQGNILLSMEPCPKCLEEEKLKYFNEKPKKAKK